MASIKISDLQPTDDLMLIESEEAQYIMGGWSLRKWAKAAVMATTVAVATAATIATGQPEFFFGGIALAGIEDNAISSS
ncbi:hypothetical protein [Scytonema sp. NUACC26]|uniref:hypothetical protein n=1 Tax=Scytonema sp. NUACC26 TaxID=3140176 RepID=UPI0034DCC00D